MAPPGLPLLVPERSNSPRRHLAPPSLQCCCGRVECVLLKRNCSVLESVEKDVHTAAQLGQALLSRHEAYMADAERDRLDLTARIERLEIDKQLLEAENALKIEENRHLLDQLEMLNNTVSDADTKIRSLESSLLSSQQTIRRLESAADRAADTERHLAILEEEQDRLHKELRSTREESRTHAQRCKEAQRGILDMQDQLERIETEARQEREKHAEIVGRMERQREVEKQLDTAAGRLKGAAATKSLGDQKHGNKIVGHFVRDLLQDNANLQLGIAELRELLMNSNDEVQSLREQLIYHQPTSEPEHNYSPASTLRAELEPQQEAIRLSQELHVHHHYHVKNDIRKPKKKRHGLMPGIFTPPGHSRPSTPGQSNDGDQWALKSSPIMPALLSQSAGAGTSTPARGHNWRDSSNPPSDFSSVPSSPQSNQRSFLFDHGFTDSDPLTSPSTSYDPLSPTMRASHHKHPSVTSTHSFQSLSRLDTANDAFAIMQATQKYPENAIQEEDEDLEQSTHTCVADELAPAEQSTKEDTEYAKDDYVPPRRLHRAGSHESIMSLTGGLDIHTLKIRPSQMTLRPLGGADAVITGVNAQPVLSRSSGKRSSAALRDNFAVYQSSRAASTPMPHLLSTGSAASSGGPGGLVKWVGWRPWGGGGANPVVAESTPSLEVPEVPTDTPTPQVKSRVKDVDRERDLNRAPGINQPGIIPGFQQYWAAHKRKGAPAKVTPESIDRDALVEGLQE